MSAVSSCFHVDAVEILAAARRKMPVKSRPEGNAMPSRRSFTVGAAAPSIVDQRLHHRVENIAVED